MGKLRFDGYYYGHDLVDNWYDFLRFYRDGTVLKEVTPSDTGNYSPEEVLRGIMNSLNKDMGFYKGNYILNGNQISFDIESPQSRETCEGIVTDDGFQLVCRHSMNSYNPRRKTFQFIQQWFPRE